MTFRVETNPMLMLNQQPQPCPTNDAEALVRLNGKEWVMIAFDTPTGKTVVFYEPQAAQELANRIRSTALGLQLAPNESINGKDG